MAMKVLSGILVVRDQLEGQVKINLETNNLVDPPEGVRVGKREIVGSGRYMSTPCKMVALREIKIRITHPRGPSIRDRIETDFLRIDDVSIDRDFMEIKWKSEGSQIEEISYMVIGET